ncbi:MAG: hypothetical protein ACRD0Y_14525 [Terriglobales bacterium]
MRTTVDIPDALYRQLKAKAASAGQPVKALILAGVERELGGEKPRRRRHVRLPIIHSKHPGTLDIDNQRIYEIIPFP